MRLIPLLFSWLPLLAVSSVHAAPAARLEDLPASDMTGIRAAHEKARHAIMKDASGKLSARNPGQQWDMEFDGHGFLVTPDHGQWTWGLELTGYGDRTLASVSSSALQYDGGKITIPRDEILTEWFINDSRGLEQGWTFQSRPEGIAASAPLTLHLNTRGGLQPVVSENGSQISFQQESGAMALTYGGLKAWDADGKTLAVKFGHGIGNGLHIEIDEKGARYPVTIDPVAQQAYLKASNTDPGDIFGRSIAISGDTVVVGAPYEASSATGVNGDQTDHSLALSGAAYVFVRSGNTWTQQAYLKPGEGTKKNGNFGCSVGIDGDTIVVGFWGYAYVFNRANGIWSQQARLETSGSTSDSFGFAVAISKDLIVVGAHTELDRLPDPNGLPPQAKGAAFVFKRTNSAWSELAYLAAPATETQLYFGFGLSVSISGNTVAVGSPYQSANGKVYIFADDGAGWHQQGASLTEFRNSGISSQFGTSVSVSGDTLVVGAPTDSSGIGVDGLPQRNGPPRSGAAYVYIRSGDTWTGQAFLKASNAWADFAFGQSVAVAGENIVVGSPQEMGRASGVDGNQKDLNTLRGGAAYLFTRTGTTWSQRSYLKSGFTGFSDRFGSSVAIAEGSIAVGADEEASNSPGVNGDPTNDDAYASGAAYVFDLDAPDIPEISVNRAAQEIQNGYGTKVLPTGLGSSTDAFFTLRNVGTGPLNLSGTPVITISGDAGFTIVAQPQVPAVVPGGLRNFIVRYAPQATGSHQATILIASNDADEPAFTFTVNGTCHTPRWLFNTAASGSGLTGNDALASASPHGDGVKNLLKYAFNMSLTKPGSHTLASGSGKSGLPAMSVTGTGTTTKLRLEFIRRKGSGLVYTPKRSSTLDLASFVPMTGTPVISSIDEKWERVVVTEPADPASLPALFATVEVSLGD